MSSKKTITIHRSAKTGQFVTPAQVKRSPSTTETEKRPAPKKRSRKG